VFDAEVAENFLHGTYSKVKDMILEDSLTDMEPTLFHLIASIWFPIPHWVGTLYSVY
jgi:hypothetical protein